MTGLEAIYQKLSVDTAVRDAVQHDAGGEGYRVFYDNMPAGEVAAKIASAIVLDTGVENRRLIHRKSSGRVEGFTIVNCLAPTKLGAEDLSLLVVAALDGFRGVVASGASQLLMRSMSVESVEPIPIRLAEGESESSVHGVRCDVRYAYREQVTVHTG